MRAAALALVLALSSPVHAQGVEPRLPTPPETPSAAETLIQRAVALYASGNFRESAAVWQTVAADQPVIEALARRESVRALIAAGDIVPALTGLTELGSAAPAELLLSGAAACRSARAVDCAERLYRRAREAAGRTPVADEAALGLAALLEERGLPAEALEAYRELQLTFRQASAFDTADAAVRRLTSQLGDIAPLTEDDYDSIVDRLVSVAAFRRSVDLQIEWLKQFPLSVRRTAVEAAIVRNLYSLRANDDSRARARAFLKERPDSQESADVFITLFRLDVREGRTADVEQRGRAILGGTVPGTSLADRQGAARLLAEYLVSVGEPSKALGIYDELYKLTRTRAGRVDVLWRMAVASIRAGRITRAIKELEQVLRLKPDSETGRAATFWLGYAQEAAGSAEAARRHWISVVQEFPFSYYGVRAAARAGVPMLASSLRFPDFKLSDLVVQHADYQAAALLSRAGLLTDAAVYARRLNAAFRRDDAVALLAARASEAAGDHTSASTLMTSYFGPYLQRPAANLPEDFWTLAYPRAYWQDVSAAGARHGVDPLLMLGLARQESHFNRMARSPVGAVGLFQVMPYTAAELDPSFSSPGAMERLVDPPVSAELAARLLARLQTQYGGAAAPTIASYNADTERVQVWWNAAKGLAEELFIDSIPYRETRAYVRQVLANYAMYQRSAQSALPQK